MNIAMVQQLSPKVTMPKQAASAATNGQLSNEKFGSVFNEILAASNQPTMTSSTTAQTDLGAVEQLMKADSLESVLEILGIPHDEALLFVEVEGEAIAVESMMNLDDLAAALDIEKDELMMIVQQLLGEEAQVEDVWTFIEQAPNLVAQIMSALQGEHQVAPQQAEKVLAVLKLAEVIGAKVDTVYNQEWLLAQVKEAFQQIAPQLQQAAQTQQQNVQEAPKTVVFQQVIKQEVENSQPTSIASQPASTAVKTVTLTLPAERPAQSEALLKEIQNLINRSQLSNTQGTMRLMLKLYPENLGSIRIEIMQKDGMLTARLLASTAVGKELLDSNLQQLKTAFAAQNIQMERIDVSQALQDAERNMRDQSFFNNFFKQQQNEEQETQNDEDDDDKKSFSEFLSEEV